MFVAKSEFDKQSVNNYITWKVNTIPQH